MTATPLPQCEDCTVRPIGIDARCAWCTASRYGRHDPFAAAGGLPPWLTNTEIDRTRRRSTVEAILRTYRPDEVNWSAVASLLGVSRQAVHQLKRRLVESAARRPEESADQTARATWPGGRTDRGRASSRSGLRQAADVAGDD